MEYRETVESVNISIENGSLVYGVRYRVGMFDTKSNRWTPHATIEGRVLDASRAEDANAIAALISDMDARLPGVVAERDAARTQLADAIAKHDAIATGLRAELEATRKAAKLNQAADAEGGK